jgi:hypothetical protein
MDENSTRHRSDFRKRSLVQALPACTSFARRTHRALDCGIFEQFRMSGFLAELLRSDRSRKPWSTKSTERFYPKEMPDLSHSKYDARAPCFPDSGNDGLIRACEMHRHHGCNLQNLPHVNCSSSTLTSTLIDSRHIHQQRIRAASLPQHASGESITGKCHNILSSHQSNPNKLCEGR